MNKEQKAALVEEMASQLGEVETVFAIDYRGISVPGAAELRVKLAEADASFRIVKNRLAKRAAEKAGTEGLDELFEGPTALTLVRGDPVSAAKAIATFSREHDVLEFKGGFMEGSPLEADQFKAIARLPGLDVLQGRLVGMAASPLTGVTRGLASLLAGLASQLGQIQEKGLVEGEVEEEKPSAEEPTGEEGADGEAASEQAEESADEETESEEAAEEAEGQPEASEGSEKEE